MKAILVVVSLLVLASVTLAQVTTDQGKLPLSHISQLVWEPVLSPVTQTLGNVERSSGDTVYAGNGNNFLKSTDAGLTWFNRIPPHIFGNIAFFDALRGLISSSSKSDNLYYTSDGGESWSARDAGLQGIEDVEVVGKDTAFACVDETIARSIDGGESWTQYEMENAFRLTSLSFADHRVGYATGEKALYYPDELLGIWGAVLKTTNGGATWEQLRPSIAQDIMAVCAVTRTRVVVAGASGGISLSIDGGKNWTTRETGIGTALRNIHFVDSLHGWIVGWEGVLLFTTDGGLSWNRDSSVPNVFLGSITFVNDTTGIIVGENGLILRSRPGVAGVQVSDNATFEIMPNPAFRETQIMYSLDKAGPVRLRILSMAGHVVLDRRLIGEEGINRLTLAIDDIPSGHYLCVLDYNGSLESRSFIIE